MSAFLTASQIPGKGITGYKVYKNIATTYGGITAGMSGYHVARTISVAGGTVVFFNINAPINASGTLTTLTTGLYYSESETDQLTDSEFFVCSYYIADSGGTDALIMRDYVGIAHKFIGDIGESDIVELEIPGGLSVQAGDILAIYTATNTTISAQLSSSDGSVYLNYYDSTAVVHPSALGAISVNNAKLNNYADINDYKMYLSFEAHNDFSDSWTEVTNGGSGLSSVTTGSFANGSATYNTTFVEQPIVALEIGTTINNATNMEIEIDYSGSTISVYYGDPEYYAHAIVSPGSGYLFGFPFTTNEITITRDGTLTYTPAVTVYTYNRSYDGYKFPLVTAGSYEYIAVDTDNIDTQCYYYSIVPVTLSGTLGSMSIPVSNRINI